MAGQTGAFSDKNAGNGKAVTVTGTTLLDTASGLASNYTVSNPTGLTASITAKALTVAGQLAGNKVYDGNAQARLSGGALSGLVAGETLGIAGQTAVFSDKNAANGKAVTVTGTTLRRYRHRPGQQLHGQQSDRPDGQHHGQGLDGDGPAGGQ